MYFEMVEEGGRSRIPVTEDMKKTRTQQEPLWGTEM